MTDPSFAVVRFSPGSAHQVSSGLLGFVSFQLGEVLLDGVAVRRTRDGELTLSFPQRRDRSGRTHDLIRPIDQTAIAPGEMGPGQRPEALPRSAHGAHARCHRPRFPRGSCAGSARPPRRLIPDAYLEASDA